MDKCRICLSVFKRLDSIFDECDGCTYAEMITSITNVKISKEENITDKICRHCRRKLKDTYQFKVLIERSDAVLHQGNHLKRINFNNINDIKIEIEFSELNIKQDVKKCEDFEINLKNGENLSYNDTTIVKIDVKQENVDNTKKSLLVSDFLKTIREESGDEYNDTYYAEDTDIDDEYLPPILKLRKKSNSFKHRRNKSIATNKKEKVNKVTKANAKLKIKPVILDDIRLVPTKPVTINRKPKIHKSYTKEDICPYCGKLTKTLKSHLLVHTGERKHKCIICSKGFFTASSLKCHFIKHVTEKSFKCDKCVAAFNNENSLERHKLTHSDVKNFICATCNKGFKRKGAMMRHSITHNSANKNIMCEFCNMSFFTKCNLRHHMRVHTGERPFNCELCSQPYSYKHDFNRHCFKKHGIFLKRRAVYVMNEEVLQRERKLMKELMLRAHGVVREGEDPNPFATEGPQAALAFEQAMKVLENKPIPIDIHL